MDKDSNVVLHSGCDTNAKNVTSHLLDIFPEEVWLLILNKVSDSTDLLNLANTSPFFHELLTPRATKFLFPKVFNVMISKWNSSKDFISDIIPTCRLVCRSWNQSIENLAESHNSCKSINAEENASQYAFDGIKIANVTFPLHNRSGISEFLEHFDKSHYFGYASSWKNPFLGRRVTFNDTLFHPGRNTSSPLYWKHFCNDISNLLIKYGSHIWYCTIYLEDKFGCREDYYFQLCEWLDMMPNIKGLNMMYYSNLRNKRYSVAHLEREILNHPLPKPRHLEYLNMNKFPTPILTEFLHISQARGCKINFW